MTTLLTDRQPWVQAVCRQFTDATGWPLVFTPAGEADAAVIESRLQADGGTCWYREVSDGVTCTGFLHLEWELRPERSESFSAACELADVVAQLISRVCTAERLLELQDDGVTTLVDVGRELSHADNLPALLTRLLHAALRLTGFRAGGFFLLNPETSELTLRVAHVIDVDDIPAPRRSLVDHPPDLEALTKGRVLIHRGNSSQVERWLPERAATGLCMCVQSEAGPLGTLWAYDRRQRTPTLREQHVLDSIAAQMAAVLERVVLLQDSAAGSRLQREMRVASEGQSCGLTGSSRDPRLDVCARCHSRCEVGGDLCELIPLDEHRTAVVVGDASGDSIPAALIMAGVRGALHALPGVADRDDLPTHHLVARLNDVLCRITPSHQFMSLFYGVWDSQREILTYTNAGHPGPILARQGQWQQLDSQGLLLGVVPETTYGRCEVAVPAGTVLVAYTDGVTEALNSQRQMFRVEGIVRTMSTCLELPAADILEAVWRRLEAHTADTSEPDDRTLLVIRAR